MLCRDRAGPPTALAMRPAVAGGVSRPARARRFRVIDLLNFTIDPHKEAWSLGRTPQA
jgi:hypothetical protein